MPEQDSRSGAPGQRVSRQSAGSQGDFLYAVDDDSVAAGYAAHIPAELRQRGLKVAHRAPLVGIKLEGRDMRSFRVEPSRAWDFHYIEINPAHSWAVLTFDCDRGDVDRPVPMPHWEVVNEENGHIHAGYVLRNPVHRYRGARSKPREYATAIEAGLIRLLDADAGYTGVLTRNPGNPGPSAYTIWYARTEPYDLFELADWLELGTPAKDRQSEGQDTPADLLDAYRVGCIGRNTYLHRWGIGRAFRLAHTHPLHRIEPLMLDALADENIRRVRTGDFASPLPDHEIGHIAKSNAKYVEKKYDSARFAEIQAHRASRPRPGRRTAIYGRALAIYEDYHVHRLRQEDIARRYGVSQQAVSWTVGQVRRALLAEGEDAAIADRDAEIVAAVRAGAKQVDVARDFGLSPATISRKIAFYQCNHSS